MKLAISGKGGVGKTTLTALLACRLAARGRRVLAVDADPNANLAATLGFPDPANIVPIIEMKDLIAERMGTKPGAVGAYFRLNPRVDDLPAKYCVEHEGVRLIVMGTVTRGGAGCACPENAFLKALLDQILLGPDEDVLVDTEAGLEHMGRATAAAVDGLVVVVDPGLRSVETFDRILRLAGDIGIRRSWVVANKVGSSAEKAFLEGVLEGGAAAWIPASKRIAAAGRGEMSLRDVGGDVWNAVDGLLSAISRDGVA